MHKALHPYSKEHITVDEYIREFGREGISEKTTRPRCFLCKSGLFIRALSTPNSSGHFSHFPTNAYCPSKATSGLPYLGLYPRKPNQENAIRLKSLFSKNWQKHFLKLKDLAPGLHINEFKEVIKAASRERIWEYAELQEFQLPYVFSTLIDFPSTTSILFDKKYVRKCWFRFWFDSSVKQYEDLWIYRTEPLTLTRAWYKQPKRGKPTLDDFVDAYSVNITSDFLNNSNLPSPYVINTIQPWIEQIFSGSVENPRLN